MSADWRGSWLDHACAHLPYVLLLLESDFTVRAHLGRALPENFPVRLKFGRLVLPSPIRRRVRLLLSSARVQGPGLIKIHVSRAASVTLVVERLFGLESSVLWTARLFAEDGVVPSSEALRVTYAMTPSESGVVRQLLTGRCLRAAAQQLKISHETARSHLKSAFIKTNVRCQAALVARVLSGPAIVLGQDRLTRSAATC